jgi:glucosyl-3-phosphoglycerate synthase
LNTDQPYRILIALSDVSLITKWVNFALLLANEPLEIYICGMIVIPEGLSLSEGTRAAQLMRDSFGDLTLLHPTIHNEARVYVDFEPFAQLFEVVRQKKIDVLVVQWNGADQLTGGVSTDSILSEALCDLILVSRNPWEQAGPVLLSLRGGPNLSLGTKVAEILASNYPITLLHAKGPGKMSPLAAFLSSISPIKRTVTAEGDISALILSESVGHNAIVMGAGLGGQDQSHNHVSSIVQEVSGRTSHPLIVVRAYQPEEIAFHRPRQLHAPQETLSTRVDRWFAENTFNSSEFSDLNALLDLKHKQGITISLGLPALNEEATIAKVISTIKAALMDDIPLLDEIVLIDSNSIDRTVEIARSLGVSVYSHADILLLEVGSVRGKGEALWKSLHVLKGDIIVWIDTDITNIHPRFVYGLIGPLLKRPDVQYVKGFYQRPINADLSGGHTQAQGGGRVTELVARPLLNLFFPELSGIVQPLSGEYAGRRTALEVIPFFSGYGVETGLLIDIHERFGLSGLAQCDLEERIHHNQSLISLSKMSFAILQVFISRLEGRYGVQLLEQANTSMNLIIHEPDRLALEIEEIGDTERPPIVSIPGYARLNART